MPEVSMPPEAASMPDPGAELICRVAGGPDLASFYWSGRESVRDLERTLAIAGRSLDSFESILDFGCGCGRMLLWMEELGRTSALHGTDIDTEAVEWCRAHLPYVNATVNREDPPLPYPDGAFDLVFNHSVFTHIDERRQDAWLTELQRVTRPGALLVLSTHGETALPDDQLAIRDILERHGVAFLDKGTRQVTGLPEWYQTTFHAPWYVFEHWGKWFEIRGFVPGGDLDFQDHVLLQHRGNGTRPRLPIAARPPLPSEGAPNSRVDGALQAALSYRATGRGGRSGVRSMVRQLILRAIQPYTAHEDRFDKAVAASIADLINVTTHHSLLLEALERRLRDGGR